MGVGHVPLRIASDRSAVEYVRALAAGAPLRFRLHAGYGTAFAACGIDAGVTPIGPEVPTMLRLWITLLLVLLLIGAVVGALTRVEPKRLWAFALGLLCVGLIGGGLLWILAL